jgi:zinc-ribbon domain
MFSARTRSRLLYCAGLQLPEAAEFYPECGRPIEAPIRVERAGKLMSTTRAKGCLYCGMRLPESAEFCPECGRPRERSFAIRPIQASELDRPHKEMKGTGALPRQQGFASECSDPHAHPGNYPKRGTHLAGSATVTPGTLSTRQLSSFQSDQPIRSRVRRVRAASAFKGRGVMITMQLRAPGIHPGLMMDLYHPDSAYVSWQAVANGLATFDLYTRTAPSG